MIHPAAIVEPGVDVDESTNVWAFAHIMPGASIGTGVNIGDHCFVEGGSRIGNNVTLKNAVSVWEGIYIEADCFIGPGATFTNDLHPRSPRMQDLGSKYASKGSWLKTTTLRRGCTLGARCVILPGRTIGYFAMVGAGAVVTKDVPDFALVTGNPATIAGSVCVCGAPLACGQDRCDVCGMTDKERQQRLVESKSQSSAPGIHQSTGPISS